MILLQLEMKRWLFSTANTASRVLGCITPTSEHFRVMIYVGKRKMVHFGGLYFVFPEYVKHNEQVRGQVTFLQPPV